MLVRLPAKSETNQWWWDVGTSLLQGPQPHCRQGPCAGIVGSPCNSNQGSEQKGWSRMGEGGPLQTKLG